MESKTPTCQRARQVHGLAAVICVGLYLSVISCTTPNYGKLESSSEITAMFENGRILSEHLYYYSGLQGVPDAIIGIHPDYALRPDSWRQVKLTPQILTKWVFRMRTVSQIPPRGAWIMSPEANRVGIWFSSQQQTPVRLEQNHRLVVVAPRPPDLQEIR